jgi:glycosyltransferase involved in cell wall biosynthesis
VCAARFVSIKNHKTLVRAFAKVSEEIPRARLILAGDGPQRSAVEMLVESLELRDKIQFVGSVSRDRVYELYAGADAFVIASYAEGFCVAAVEALAAGLPIIASDVPALREVLDDAALFADPDDPDSFKMQLKKVLTTPDLAAQLSTNGSKRSKKFSLEQAAHEYLNIYMQVGTRTDSRANLI